MSEDARIGISVAAAFIVGVWSIFAGLHYFVSDDLDAWHAFPAFVTVIAFSGGLSAGSGMLCFRLIPERTGDRT